MKLNIKKLVIWLTVIMVACFITAGIILAVFGNLGITLEKIDETKTIETEGVDEISIDITSTDIDIISTDEGEITVHLYGEVSANSKKELPALIAYKTGKELRIEIARPRMVLIGINIWRTKLDVYVPKDLIETLKIDTVSSDTRISDLNVNKINIRTVSGDVEINLSEDARFYIRADSVSGDIKNKFPIKIISSGRTNLEGVVGGDEKEIIVSAPSGDITIDTRNER